MGITFDYHSHHRRCGHASGEMEDYIAAARARGLTEFGVSDHCPAFFLEGDDPQPTTSMARSALPGYLEEALALKARYAGRIALRVGIEADYVPGSEAEYARVLAACPFDYVLGSVHWVGGILIFDRSRWDREDPETTYAAYYGLVAAAARSGMFDMLAHLTAIEAFGPPLGALADRLYPSVVEAVVASGAAVEINASGFRKMGGDEPFPNRRMLRMLVEAGVPLTYGSDCHRPDEVGHGRDRVEALLRELGLDPKAPRETATRRGVLKTYRR